MSNSRSNKLTCIVTGRKLIATKDYYARKVEKAGDEQTLHDTYVCREAKNLIKQGTSITKIREILNAKDMNSDVPQHVIDDILQSGTKTNFRRINNIINTNNMMVTTSDPEVKEYIERLKHEE